jgi:hypothetical protein
MTQDQRTITVDSYFGEKEVTKKDFTNRWLEHVQELSSLTVTSEDYETYKTIKDDLLEMVGRRFEEIYEAAQK